MLIFRAWLVCLALAGSLFGGAVAAQTIGQREASKTSPEVIEKAKQGVAQDLFVAIDIKDVEERQRQSRDARGLNQNDRSIVDEAEQQMAAIKRSIFPLSGLADTQIVEEFAHLPHLKVRVLSYRGLARLLQHPRVLSVHEERPFRPALSETLPLIGQPSAAAAGKSGAGYRVAVLDSGVDLRNLAFVYSGSTGCRLTSDPNWGHSSGPFVGSAGCRLSNVLDFNYSDPLAMPLPYWNPVDPTGHGTNVIGIVAGVAPGTRIDSLRVFNPSDGRAHWTEVSRALSWVLANFDKPPAPIVAVNMSFGSGNFSECSGSLYSGSFNQLLNAGIIPVVATGNDGNTNGVGEPACASGAVRVGNVYDRSGISDECGSDRRVDEVVCTSNSSALLTLLAPGRYTAAAGTLAGGTSQAAPHVAGAVAVLKQAFPSDGPTEIVSRMTASGKSVTDSRNNVTTPRLNLSAALATGAVGGALPPALVAPRLVAPILAVLLD